MAEGQSLGSYPVLHLGASPETPIAGVMLEAPIVSLERACRRCLFNLECKCYQGVGTTCCDMLENWENFDALDCPVLLLHGSEDHLGPLWEVLNGTLRDIRIR